MNLSPKYKLLIIAIITILCVSAAGAAFTWLALHTKTITGNMRAVEAELATLEHERGQAHEIETDLENKKDIVMRIQNVLASHDRPIALLDALNRLGSATQTKISIDYSEQESDASSLVFRLTAEGESDRVQACLKLIEQMPYAMRVEDINWQRIPPFDSESRQNTRLLLTLRVKTQP